MSNKWILQGVQREGFDGVWRAGRFWPSNKPVEVEVLDQEEEPTVEVDSREGKRRAPDPSRLTAKSFAAIMKDGRITKLRAEDAAGATGPGAAELREVLTRAVHRIHELERLLDESRLETKACETLLDESRSETRACMLRIADMESAAAKAPQGSAETQPTPPPAAPPAPPPAEEPEDLPAPGGSSKKHPRK